MTRALVLLLFVAGCGIHFETTADLTEPGRIEQLTFAPGGTSSGVGMTMSGDVHFTSVDTPNRYAVVISCPHGKFALNAEHENARRVFMGFKTGDSITIHYREQYIVKQGVRELWKIDFLGATKRGVEATP